MARKPVMALPFGLTWSDFDFSPIKRSAPKRAKVAPASAPVAPTRRPGPKFTEAELKHIKAALHAIVVKIQAANAQQTDDIVLNLAEELRTKARLDWRISEALDNYRLACAMARGDKAKELQRG
jgi:hypothetical protein